LDYLLPPELDDLLPPLEEERDPPLLPEREGDENDLLLDDDLLGEE